MNILSYEQDISSIILYSEDWSSLLAGGDTIATSVWLANGLTVSGDAIVGAVASALVADGIAGTSYLVTNTVTTTLGRRDVRGFTVQITDITAAPVVSGLFARSTAVTALKANQLSLVSSVYPQLTAITDDVLWLKMVAAEHDLSRQLGIALSPVEIFSDVPTSIEIAALNGRPYLIEPGYDLPPNFFGPGNFGLFQLRQKPVISIAEIKLIYPNQGGASFTIPTEWIRVDNKYGHVRLFPSAQSISAPLSIMTMQAMGSGYTIPNMIRVRYTAGLDNTSGLYPDVIDLVQRMAVLRMLHDSFLPQSGSISADGFSESTSSDLSKMQGNIDGLVANLKQELVGPVWGVL